MGGISFSMANSVKFSAIFLLPWAELDPGLLGEWGHKWPKLDDMSIGEHQHGRLLYITPLLPH